MSPCNGRTVRGLALACCWLASTVVACSDDGDFNPPELNAVGKLLDGSVFAYGQDHTSKDPLQRTKGNAKKTLVYFENTARGMRYLKVVMDLSTLGYYAYAGTLTFGAGNAVTFQDEHMCHYSEQTSTELKGTTIETILTQMSGCTVPDTGPESYTLTSETIRERLVLYDASQGLTLTRAYEAVPAGVPAAAKPLLGAYQLTGSPPCTPTTPATYLLLYASPKGQLRYSIIAEKNPYDGFVLEEGTLAAGGARLDFTPEYSAICSTTSYMYPTEAPIFPPNIHPAGSACKAASQPPAPYGVSYALSDASCTLFLEQLQLTTGQATLPYMRGPLVFPGTSGKGAHYLWGVLAGT